LSTARPTGSDSRSYKYDPTDPVATVGGAELGANIGPRDQRSIEARPDVLLFTSDVLEAPLEVTGRITARLYATSDCPDTDFTVKLTDVYPDGRSMLVTDGIVRARHRESFETEKLLEPGEVVEIPVDLWSTSLVFNKGHRLGLPSRHPIRPASIRIRIQDTPFAPIGNCASPATRFTSLKSAPRKSCCPCLANWRRRDSNAACSVA
jgi:predicted acyl esterase